MDAKLEGRERTHPQLSGKLCWKKIALLVIEILKVKVGYLFSNNFM
jgi:hypothetical protein